MKHKQNLFLGALFTLVSFFGLASVNAVVKMMGGSVPDCSNFAAAKSFWLHLYLLRLCV